MAEEEEDISKEAKKGFTVQCAKSLTTFINLN